MEDPLTKACQEIAPVDASDKRIRYLFPKWVETQGSDDYVDYQWTAPSTRLYTANAVLEKPEPEYTYPNWARYAMNGYAACVDPGIICAAKTIGATIIDLVTKPSDLAAAKQEFVERTGKEAIITSLTAATDAVDGKTGTRIVPP